MSVIQQKETKSEDKDIEEVCSERVEELVESIKEEDFSDFLETLEMIRKVKGDYSFNNLLLIKMQLPSDKGPEEPIVVNGYNQWQEYGRQVKQGESAIKILAPKLYKACPECGNTKKYHNNSDCEDDTDYDEWDKKCFGFYPVSVFDISQTKEIEGEDSFTIPEDELEMKKSGAQEGMFEEIAEKFEEYVNSIEVAESLYCNGLYKPDTEDIVIKQNNEATMVGTLAHEIAHHFNHDSSRDYSRGRKEMFVESVSYIVCRELGINSEDSKKYIKGWEIQDDEDLEVLREDIDEIVKISTKLINKIREV